MQLAGVLWTIGVVTIGAWADTRDFSGWQAIRVIEQDGRPNVLRAADVDGDGRQELIVVNSRYSRLDIYAFSDSPSGASHASARADATEAVKGNVLPMAEHVRLSEIQLEQLPVDVVSVPCPDCAGVARQLAVLVSSPNRILFYQLAGPDGWQLDRRVDLLDGDVASGAGVILVDERETETSILIPFDEGIQQLPLASGQKASWLEPRSRRGFADWWLADLNADGVMDIVEQRRDAEQALCWLRGTEEGRFEPARVLLDRSVRDARVLNGFQQAPVVVLDGAAQSMIRRYEYALGEPSALGKLRPLPLASGAGAAWCGMRLGQKDVLVTADPKHPRLQVYGLTESGWETVGAFPSISDVQGLAAPQAEAESLLLWVKDSPQLYLSQWDGSRLSYPTLWNAPADSQKEQKVVALATTGSTTWWAVLTGGDVVMHLWSAGEAEPREILFSGVGATVEQVLWLGDERILIKDRRARGLKLAQVVDNKTELSQPSSIARAELSEFRVLAVGDQLQTARFVGGVMQWLSPELQPVDQVMLADERELADFVAESATSGWALEKGAPYLHRIAPDAAGVAQAGERIKLVEGTALVQDPYLGLLLLGRDNIAHISQGSSDVLVQQEAFDDRSEGAGGGRKSNCHRFLITDVNLDGRTELIICDDRQHRLTVMSLEEGQLETLAAWPIFEDLAYPYGEMGDYGENLVAEPRAVCGLDFDGDEWPDLGLLCHDRLLIYLGREPR